MPDPNNVLASLKAKAETIEHYAKELSRSAKNLEAGSRRIHRDVEDLKRESEYLASLTRKGFPFTPAERLAIKKSIGETLRYLAGVEAMAKTCLKNLND